MRKIALDVGDVRIGVAVSDPLGITAQGLTVIERVGIRKDCDKIMDLIKEWAIFQLFFRMKDFQLWKRKKF